MQRWYILKKGRDQQFQPQPPHLLQIWGSTLALDSALQESPVHRLPPSRPALACLFCFSLLLPCHFMQYSSFKRARILFWSFRLSTGLLGLLFCHAINPSVYCLFNHHFAFPHVFGLFHSTGLPKSWFTKALQSSYALAEHTTSFAHFLSFTTSSEVVIYDNAHEASFLFIGTDSYIWSVEETVLHSACRKLHYRQAFILVFKILSTSQNTGKSTVSEG